MTDAASDSSVHRLVDMVVEEVSLVDRAANKRRFLIVKRDEDMSDEELEKAPEDDTPPDEGSSDAGPLTAAAAALESLTALVESLATVGIDGADTRLTDLANELRMIASSLSGDSEPPAETESEEPSDAEKQAKSFDRMVAATKSAIARFAELARAARPQKAASEPTQAPSPAPAAQPSALESTVEKLAQSVAALRHAVDEQSQRLGRVEKQFGTPASAPPEERPARTRPTAVGWPLDLNKPMDRESVDKAVSFHSID
jgi:uncharacterized coiled-coil protein SlyX